MVNIKKGTDISGKANVELDNLSGVAINTSLISDTDSTDDLGSSSIHWRDLYIDRILQSTIDHDLIIEHDGQDKDIIFKVNDGGVDTEIMNMDGSSGFIGIGIDTPDVNLHIHKGSAGTVNTAGNVLLTLENSSHAYLQFMTPNDRSSRIYFGDPQNVSVGTIEYTHSNNTMTFTANQSVFAIDSTNALFPISDSSKDLGKSTHFWDETFTDELVLQQGTMGATAADQVRLAGLDLSAGDAGLHIKTENDTEHLFASKVGIGNVSPQELLHVGTGTDASDISATDLLVTRAGPSNLSVRDSTNGVETFLFASSVGGVMGTVTNDPLNIQTNNASAIFIDASQKVGIGTGTPNETLTIEAGVLSIKETTTPTATTDYGKIWTETNNELFFQSGDGLTHLLHGDAFSEIWFHGASTVEVTISTQNVLTKIDSFTVVGNEDDITNVVGSVSTNDLTLSSIAGGGYEISFHSSFTATGGADKEMMICLGITLATPKDITDVTDNLVTPIVITSTAHGLENGDMVEIVGVLGNTAANGSFIVSSKADNTFEIVALDGSTTTGNGDYDAGTPTGDVTIHYPGNMIVHRMVRGADLGAASATGLHILAGSDVIAVYVANLDGTTNLTIAAVSFDAFRIGD